MRVRIFLILTLFLNLLYSYESKLNQTKPLSKKAGRVLELKKVMRIGDEQGGFYFRYPSKLSIAADGSIYIMDMNQLLKFDQQGRFLKNFCKLGQGPGEVNYLNSFLVHNNSVILSGIMPQKIIWFDHDGNVLKELRIQQNMMWAADLIGYWGNRYYFVYSAGVLVKSEPYFADVDQIIVELSDDGSSLKNLITLPRKQYVMPLGEGGRKNFYIAELITEIYQNRYIIINHTTEYLIKIYDTGEKRLSHVFSRVYQKVNFKGTRWGKDKDAPKLKYEKDIKNIFAQQSGIWVVTSKEDDKKGALIDVFDYTGSYLDSFYLKTKGNILKIQKNNVFVRETDKDDNNYIVKYRISALLLL